MADLTITVGTDGSAQATAAVQWAADEADRRGLPLSVVHVIEDSAFAGLGANGRKSLTADGASVLVAAGKLVAERHPDLPVSTHLVEGDAPFRLREASKEAFTVVVGHRGLGGFSSLLLGSTGLQLAGYATCPVVIVRGNDPAADGDIVVGLDLYGDTEAVLRYAFETASIRETPIHAIYASPLTQLLIEAHRVDEAERIERTKAVRMDKLLSPWQKAYPHVKVVRDIVRSHPVVALADASRQAGLLVVGAYGHGVAQAALLGSISHGVIHHAHCPIAVIRPRG